MALTEQFKTEPKFLSNSTGRKPMRQALRTLNLLGNNQPIPLDPTDEADTSDPQRLSTYARDIFNYL